MKNYLNKQERMAFVQLSATATSAASIREKWTALDNMTKDEHKWLKMAETFTTKAMASILNRLPQDQHKQLLRAANATMCVCVPRESQYSFRERMKKEIEEDELIIKTDALDELAEMALVRCCVDCAHKDDQAACPCRSIFMELDIPPYDSQAKGCPWEMEAQRGGR